MTKDEALLSIMGAISMTLKGPILQQGFEILCKEIAELKAKLNAMEADRNECCRLLNLAKLSLDNAKDLINEFMRISKASDEDFEHDYSILVAQAEQFLKEVEK